MVLVIIAILIAIAMGYYAGRKYREINDSIDNLYLRLTDTKEHSTSTSTPPEEQSPSILVDPDDPAYIRKMVETEHEEKMRRINPQ